MKRGIYFTTDAFIALVIVFLVILVFFPDYETSQISTEVPGDLIETLSLLKVSEINNSYITLLINEGIINTKNKTLLEQIGELYVTNVSLARNLAQDILDEIIPLEKNIGIWYGNALIASVNK